MEKSLYLECYSGISGDMTVAALLDLGADRQVLENVLESLPAGGFRTEIKRVKKSGLDACDFNVILDEDNHDHDMEYLHGKPAESPDCHAHEEHNHAEACHAGEAFGEHMHDGYSHGEHTHFEHAHDGHSYDGHSYDGHSYDGHSYDGHSHDGHVHDRHTHEEHGGHPHMHRGLPEIKKIINSAQMTERARQTALRIFEILAEAEAKAHGVPAEQVHFHEVGAVDSIVDIVAAAVCLDNLDVTEVIVPKLCEGTGFVRCQHGLIPVPVPAVTNIALSHGLTLKITDVEGELVTPTGAAFVAAVRTSEKLPENFRILKTGLGAGKRSYSCPGILRAMLLETEEEVSDSVLCLETDIDDCTGETLGYVMERLYAAGAREVHYCPVFMKKNRPAYELTVICTEKERIPLEEIIFRETTTIGIRRVRMERSILKRRQEKVETPMGPAAAKICTLPDGTEHCYPEYERAAALAGENNISLREAFDLVCGCWKEHKEKL